ncbi:MAG: hypothetical protein C0501_09695 [Isosphaera sp.]|nr:hypothetical protein [Isosphaera sp.]
MRGVSIRLSAPRRIVGDLMHFAAGVPTVPVQRHMNVGAAAAARAALPKPLRPAWAALFTKAFALVARDVPVLRRAYVKLPTPHLYEYPVSVASVAVEREYDGEPAVFGARVTDPAGLPLADLDARLRHAMTAPVGEVKEFRRSLRVARLPRPVRRGLWWLALNLARSRPNYFGTFGVSVYSGLGAESLHPLSPLTYTLNYGVIGPDGGVAVRLVYDHRVADGAAVARALARVEETLAGPVTAELRRRAPGRRASQVAAGP